ncbi:class I SAM-dependent methyltransferase [Mucilaginibacter agri]|uniref:Methyltransferase domain-containing protein n=1 Tax=Mucilaginibacter agri TaxID=2695265 RepID=A0A965ZI13_9SPHI|nr:class I SAM-dependent methyltransferase [Mucilaginibacter agri]NCD71478.1 methyltransferase domain-containing protein [Mucilaginibacter agri]
MQETLTVSAEPTVRFSNRVENYVKYRPGYPAAVIQFLQQEFGLNADSYIADIGSGTGIFTKLLLDEGYKVYAVEPNEPMKEAAEKDLRTCKNFTSVAGTAEHTNLLANSIDLVTCATAFHWFDVEKSRDEFKRILKPGGSVALIWNVRSVDSDAFAIAYDQLFEQYTGKYKDSKERTVNGERLKGFFKDGIFETKTYPYQQVFDLDGLVGRSFSSSYSPLQDTTEGDILTQNLTNLFNKYQIDGKVYFNYDTKMYVGKV